MRTRMRNRIAVALGLGLCLFVWPALAPAVPVIDGVVDTE